MQRRQGPYTWLFFDADGTLFDYERAERKALAAAFGELGLPFSMQIGQAYQRINQEIWLAFEQGQISAAALRTERFERLFAKLGLPLDAALVSRCYLRHLADTSDLIEGAEELVKSLAGRFHLALITNGLSEVQRPRLAKSSIADCFERVVISEEIGAAKPERRFFELALEQAGQPPRERVLVIGDNLSSDIQGGFAAGLDTCWYNPSGKLPDPRWPATYLIQRLPDLKELLAPPGERGRPAW